MTTAVEERRLPGGLQLRTRRPGDLDPGTGFEDAIDVPRARPVRELPAPVPGLRRATPADLLTYYLPY
ncbi:MAG TPA: hypothetical protein VGO95_12165 [Modestobacter sp.]|jgi:hypothetical protein|nr:hypothetical protein [Modestobacter sp.]